MGLSRTPPPGGPAAYTPCCALASRHTPAMEKQNRAISVAEACAQLRVHRPTVLLAHDAAGVSQYHYRPYQEPICAMKHPEGQKHINPRMQKWDHKRRCLTQLRYKASQPNSKRAMFDVMCGQMLRQRGMGAHPMALPGPDREVA